MAGYRDSCAGVREPGANFADALRPSQDLDNPSRPVEDEGRGKSGDPVGVADKAVGIAQDREGPVEALHKLTCGAQ